MTNEQAFKAFRVVSRELLFERLLYRNAVNVLATWLLVRQGWMPKVFGAERGLLFWLVMGVGSTELMYLAVYAYFYYRIGRHAVKGQEGEHERQEEGRDGDRDEQVDRRAERGESLDDGPSS